MTSACPGMASCRPTRSSGRRTRPLGSTQWPRRPVAPWRGRAGTGHARRIGLRQAGDRHAPARRAARPKSRGAEHGRLLRRVRHPVQPDPSRVAAPNRRVSPGPGHGRWPRLDQPCFQAIAVHCRRERRRAARDVGLALNRRRNGGADRKPVCGRGREDAFFRLVAMSEAATICPLPASKPMCSFRQDRRVLVPCFSPSHSPAPHSRRPVLSTSRCRGAPSRRGCGRGTSSVLARRLSVE